MTCRLGKPQTKLGEEFNQGLLINQLEVIATQLARHGDEPGKVVASDTLASINEYDQHRRGK